MSVFLFSLQVRDHHEVEYCCKAETVPNWFTRNWLELQLLGKGSPVSYRRVFVASKTPQLSSKSETLILPDLSVQVVRVWPTRMFTTGERRVILPSIYCYVASWGLGADQTMIF